MADNEQVDMTTSGADCAADRLAVVPGIRRSPSPTLQQFMLPRFLDPEACIGLMALIDGNARPSTIADPNGDDAFRTSSTCDLDHRNPLVVTVNNRLHELVGIPLEYGEPLQGQRYDVGEEFKAHTDYFDPDGADWETYCAIPGQRSWTLMVYLNEPAAGGATRFLSTGKMHQPETGKLLAWNNIRPDGTPNPETLHHGMKVRKGRKYIITKWFRERPWPWAHGELG
ncbi:2OG-Fe(II) oxygenase [Sphingopyxis sp.]|uniref:prolyl hydroxylase family protein n=1 Tax=Sphingopyxis sp. TaxID=1908224 RepID=UPI0025F60F91|nr:2OG-Fe(II) oxygenase [Sphingopyxis sp.]